MLQHCVYTILFLSFFFFQAEDGIRDLTVTGVQTCALPISGPFYSQSAEDGSGNLYFYRGSDNGATTDIYVAPVTRDGDTRGPAGLVSELSYPARPDGVVTVRADGQEILFSSGRPLPPGGAKPFDTWCSS